MAAVAIFLLGLAAGYGIIKLTLNTYIPEVDIVGDVGRSISINQDIDAVWRWIKYGGTSLKALSLEDILKIAEPVSGQYSVYLIAEDGAAAKLMGDHLEQSFIGFHVDHGWVAINYNYPASTNIKGIKEIVVVTENNNRDKGLSIISMEENIYFTTPGQARLEATNLLQYQGSSSQLAQNQKYQASVYNQKYVMDMDSILDLSSVGNMTLMGAGGEYLYLPTLGKGIVEVEENRFNYMDNETGNKINDLVGVVINSSVDTIMDVYFDSLGYIESGQPVLLIITDGLSFYQYQYAVSQGYAPYLASTVNAEKALAVYQPVSNTGLAAMLTGKPGAINGIFSRDQRQVLTSTIFGELQEQGKNALFLEGDIQIIGTETEADLNTDQNRNGTIDDEIFNAAIENLDSGLHFIAVHFHSIDDAGHSHGALDMQTMNKITMIDSYIKQLSSSWQGKIIITSDHGMHSTVTGGDHGDFRFEDMVVPYIVFDGEL